VEWIVQHTVLIAGVCMVAVGIKWYRDAVVPVSIEGEEPFAHFRGDGARLFGCGIVLLGAILIFAHLFLS
jgi:hypothetical protein